MTTSKSFEYGPYLSASFLCEKVLEEKDGVKSVIRIIDRLIRTAASPTPSEKMEPFDSELTLLLKFKSGDARGPLPLRVNLIKPDGESAPPFLHTVYFEGEEDRGVDLVINMILRMELPGMYWFNIYLDEVLLTRVPFRLMYIPQVIRPHKPSGGSSPVDPPSGS